ncbi:hypothetical protein [Gemmata sp.]|uniref:hypothetical protein n=1 Tax=Gemmata sp. TaxID=1914242 RepID=UPI003F71ECE9
MNATDTSTKPRLRLLTLPGVSRITGVSLDKLRENRGELSEAGLIVKVGNAWVAEAADAQKIADRLRK